MTLERHPGGRPTKWTQQTRDRVIEALNNNATQRIAAGYAGICPALLCEWLAQGRRDREAGLDTEFVEFLDQYRLAESATCVDLLKTIKKASDKTWAAAAWLAERRNPTEYGRQYFNPVPPGAVDAKNVVASLMQQVIDKNISVDDAVKIAALYHKEEEIKLGRELKEQMAEFKKQIEEKK